MQQLICGVPSIKVLALLRPGTADKIVLPGNHEATRDFAEFCKELLGIEDTQLVWTEDHEMSLTISETETNAKNAIETLLAERSETDGHGYVLVPREYTSNISRWVESLANPALTPFGADYPGLFECSSAILFRHMRNINEPSVLEASVNVPVTVPRGYACRTRDELLHAFARLEKEVPNFSGRIRVHPVRTSLVHHLVLSEEELQFYDFPLGMVVAMEDVALDCNSTGLTVHPCPIFLRGELLGVVDVMRFGPDRLIICTSACIPKVRATIVNWSRQLLEHTNINAGGAVKFEFATRNGQPLLHNIVSGVTDELISLLFVKLYAPTPEHSFVTWSFTAPADLDVWTLWARLFDRRIHFHPLKHHNKPKRQGVFNLSFIRDCVSQCIALAPTREAAEELRAQAEVLIREPIPETVMLDETAFHNPTLRKVFCNGPRPEYRRLTQRYNLPSRTIPLLRPKKDLIILPGGYEQVRLWWELCRDILGLDEEQAIFTSGNVYNLDDDVDSDVLSRLKAVIACNPKDHFTLVPYGVTVNFLRWANQLQPLGNVTVYGDSLEWVTKYGHKGILHRHIQSLDKPSEIEDICPTALVAKGYTCSTVEDLLKAYELLFLERVVIKPVFGAAGEGIIFVNNRKQLELYDFPMGDVLLEEHLNLDTTKDGIVLSPAAHYLGGTLLQGLTDQIMVGTGYMGWRKSQAPKCFLKQAVLVIDKIVKGTAPKGPGGFDFLSVEGEPILSDVNTGRFNGAHFPKLFQQMYAPDKEFYCWKQKPKGQVTARQFWARLESKGIAFKPGQSTTGVFPLTFLEKLSGNFLALGSTQRECLQLVETAKSCLTCNTILREPEMSTLAPTASPSSCALLLIKNPCCVYAPAKHSYAGILVGGEDIVGLLNEAEMRQAELLVQAAGGQIIDAIGCVVTPGFLDVHVHLTGGGGEAGPQSRTAEAQLGHLLDAGTTTVVGVVGTDCITRSQENVHAKCEALQAQGITAYFWAGGYRFPALNITGSSERDLHFLKSCVGVGKLAISDYRSSNATTAQLAQLASDVHVAGLLSGKAGIVYCHVGAAPSRLQPLRDVLQMSALPIGTFLPTHMSRCPQLLEEGIQWIRAGGYVDLSAHDAYEVVLKLYSVAVNLEHVVVSSGGYGLCPQFGSDGELIAHSMINPNGAHELVKQLFFGAHWPLERILPLATSNVAKLLKLPHKGALEVGRCADFVLMGKDDLNIKYVIARGKVLKSPAGAKKGMFEGSGNHFL